VVPAACHCVFGNTGNCTGDYGWTEATLAQFVQWLESKGVVRLAIWRADIYPAYCVPLGVESWMFTIIKQFLTNSTAATAHEGNRKAVSGTARPQRALYDDASSGRAPPVPGDWVVTLHDSFDNFNSSTWTKGWSWCNGTGTSPGHPQPRVQVKASDTCWFGDSNVHTEGGNLVLTNRREKSHGFNYTSGTPWFCVFSLYSHVVRFVPCISFHSLPACLSLLIASPSMSVAYPFILCLPACLCE
jgi:hypothetical protein